jgi:hypothetical protein
MIALFLGLLCTVLVVLQIYGSGGWDPNGDSEYAKRARAVDGRLILGMTRQEVTNIYQADRLHFPGDEIEGASRVYLGVPYLGTTALKGWHDELDLILMEPRRYFWNSFDTAWVVRAGFSEVGTLSAHEVQGFKAGGA